MYEEISSFSEFQTPAEPSNAIVSCVLIQIFIVTTENPIVKDVGSRIRDSVTSFYCWQGDRRLEWHPMIDGADTGFKHLYCTSTVDGCQSWNHFLRNYLIRGCTTLRWLVLLSLWSLDSYILDVYFMGGQPLWESKTLLHNTTVVGLHLTAWPYVIVWGMPNKEEN